MKEKVNNDDCQQAFYDQMTLVLQEISRMELSSRPNDAPKFSYNITNSLWGQKQIHGHP